MAGLPGYDITVLRNGVDISDHVLRGRTSIQLGKYTRAWEIEFAEPMELATTDLWTIKRKIAGYEQIWCENALAINFTGDDGVSQTDGNAVQLRSTRRITGESNKQAVDELKNYCLPKTLVFISNDWLQDNYPNARLKDGILVYGPANLGVWGTLSTQARIYDDRLPGKEFESDSFQCIVGVQTHHAIAKYLARLIGFDVQANTPDVPIIDTMTIRAGTTWMAAIQGIFTALWFPTIEIIGTTIFVHDILADGANTSLPNVQRIKLTDDVIASASLNRTAPDKENPLDHLIITGRKTQDTMILSPETPDYTAVDLPEIELTSDLEVTATVDFSGLTKYKVMQQYDGTWGLPGEEINPVDVKTVVRTMKFHKEQSNGRLRRVPLEETVNTYDGNDVNIARKVTTHHYARGFVPTRTVEKEYVYTNMPGSEDKQLYLLGAKTTKQRHCVRPINQTLTEEKFEGLILYEKQVKDGVEYKCNPMVLADVLRADTSKSVVDTKPDTKQDVLEDTVSNRSTLISRVDDDLLLKCDQTTERLTGHTRTNSQILENPMRNRNKKKSDHKFRAEYFCGTDGVVHRGGGGAAAVGKMIGGYGPCFHAPKQINHDDISTTALSDKVAARAFARKNIDRNHEWTVKLPLTPLPIESLACVVNLPDFTARVNSDSVTVTGGDFVLSSLAESFAYEAVGNGNTVALRVDTAMVVKKRY